MKFKTKKTTDWREIDVEGQKHFVPEERTYRVPDTGRDWNAIRRHTLTSGTAFVVLASIVWSAANIFQLFQLAVPWGVALGAAVVIDIVWALFMLLEYNLRTDADAQKGPRNIGWVILGLSAAMVFYHGWLIGDMITAVFAATLTVATKILWSQVMKSHVRKFNPETQIRLSVRRDQAYAEMVTVEIERELVKARARAEAERYALQAEQPTEHRVEQLASTPEQPARPLLVQPSTPSAQPSSSILTGHEQRASTPSMLGMARDLLASGASRDDVVASIFRARPDAKPESVEAAIRRAMQQLRDRDDLTGQYL